MAVTSYRPRCVGPEKARDLGLRGGQMDRGRNDQVQPRGWPERQRAAESRHAGPVCCNDWFDPANVIPRLSVARWQRAFKHVLELSSPWTRPGVPLAGH